MFTAVPAGSAPEGTFTETLLLPLLPEYVEAAELEALIEPSLES
jgi:hypothetical protein